MSNLAIHVDNLGKRYRIGAVRKIIQQRHESYLKSLLAPFSYLATTLRPPREDEILWALKNITFEIQKGEVVGFIGRNGAGKSTLLKLLSRITAPTTGRMEVYGRVAPLLEVGTGFHPDLTGRENIYINGSLMGMTKDEITRRFDEIVAFAEIEPFIDTPVKRYSSGMSVRLAFSVAAHLIAEILLVDEVLSVGDIAFQRKCIGLMDEVAKTGRTILFVSHSMPTISRLCTRAFLLHKGQIISSGATSDVVAEYLKLGMSGLPTREWMDDDKAPGNDVVRLLSLRAITEDGKTEQIFDVRKPIGIEMVFSVLQAGHRLFPHIRLFNAENTCIMSTNDFKSQWYNNSFPTGVYKSTAWIPGNLLSDGNITIGVAVSEGQSSMFYEPNAIILEVIDRVEGDSVRGEYTGEFPGTVRPFVDWTTEKIKIDKR